MKSGWSWGYRVHRIKPCGVSIAAMIMPVINIHIAKARERGLNVCTHLIIGLPGEDATACLDTLHQVVAQGVSGLKLHPLHFHRVSANARRPVNTAPKPLQT